MVEYDVNKEFGIEVEEDENTDKKWKLACLNVDLALNFSLLTDALNNRYLMKTNPSLYYERVMDGKKALWEVHKQVLGLVKQVLGGK